MSFGSAEAFQADVVFRTNVSQFEGDQAQIRALAERTYGALDAGSLKAALASEKYDRALARSKGSAYAVAKATAAYKSELAGLEAAENRASGGSSRHAGALKAEERAFGGVIRGGIAGSGVLNRFGRAAIFASTSVLGGYGLVYALRTVVGAAREQGIALAHLQGALVNNGLDWDRNRGHIDQALASLVKVTGFTDNELTESLATTVRRFGDVNQGIHATALAADVARQKGISLVDATNLLIRASLGQSRSAKSLGVDVAATTAHVDQLRATTKNATAEQIAAAKAADQQASRLGYLSAIQAKYHGDAARFLATDAGKQALFNAELDRTEEIIGGAILPTFNRYLEQGSEYLDHLNKTGKLQRDVNRITHDAETVIHDVTGAIKLIDHATGGFTHTLELLLGLKIASTMLRWQGALGGLSGTAGTSGTGLRGAAANASSLKANLGGLARMGAISLGITLLVNAKGNGVGLLERLTGGALVGGSSGGVPGALIGGTAGAIAPYAKDAIVDDSTSPSESIPVYRDGKWVDPATGNPVADQAYWNREFRRGHGAKEKPRSGQDAYAGAGNAAQVAAYRRRARGLGGSDGDQAGPPIPKKGGRGDGGGGGGGDVAGLPYGGPFGQNALLEAQGTAGTADDLKVLNDQLGYLNKALAQKGLSGADRNQLLSERNDVLSQREQILKAAATAQKQAADAAARKQKQRFAGLTHVPAVLVKRFADAEAAHKPNDVLETIRRQEIAALQRQEKTLKSDHAPESYIATIAKEIDSIQGKIDDAIRKARKARIDKLDAVPVNLRIAEANAIANNASAERLAAIYRKEREALDKQLVQLKKIHATKQEILKNRTAAADVEKKLAAIEKQQKADSGALARELQDAVAGLAQYAPNVTEALASIQGGTVVNNHQYFPHPPTDDGSREAIFARHALMAAFDG